MMYINIVYVYGYVFKNLFLFLLQGTGLWIRGSGETDLYKAVVFTSDAGVWHPQAGQLGREGHSGLDPTGWTQTVFAPVASDFTGKYVLQKLGPFIRELNLGTWPRS